MIIEVLSICVRDHATEDVAGASVRSTPPCLTRLTSSLLVPRVWCPLRVRALCYCTRWNSWAQKDPSDSASVRPTQRRAKQSRLYLRRRRPHIWLRDPMRTRNGCRPILSRRCLPHDVSIGPKVQRARRARGSADRDRSHA